MQIRQFEIWVADLNPQIGTETGKTRPVIIIQSDLLNKTGHPSSIVCPLTTNVNENAEILRVHLKQGDAGLLHSCDIMIDQIRAIDNKRLITKLGRIPEDQIYLIKENLRIVMDIE